MSGAERDLLNQVLGLLAELDRIMAPHRRREGARYSVELVPPPPLPPTALPGDGRGAALPPARGIEAWQSTPPPEPPKRPPPPIPWVEPPSPRTVPDPAPEGRSPPARPDGRDRSESSGVAETPPTGVGPPDPESAKSGEPKSDSPAPTAEGPRTVATDAGRAQRISRPPPPDPREAPPQPDAAPWPEAEQGPLYGRAAPADPPLNTDRQRAIPSVDAPQPRSEFDSVAKRTAAPAADHPAAARRLEPPNFESAAGAPARTSSAPAGTQAAPADRTEADARQSEVVDEEPEFGPDVTSGTRRGRTLFFRGRRATVLSGEAARGLETRLRGLFLDRAIRRLT